jgi:putative transposase
MILIHLDDATRDELQTLRRTDLPARARDRPEMVAPPDSGWSPPRIARHLSYCEPTVRAVLKDFLGRGTAALFPRRTGPPPDAERRREVTAALAEQLGQDRTWTSRQRAAALADRRIDLSPRQVRRYPATLGAGWRRAAGSRRHEQGTAEVARAEKVLGSLEKRRPRAA